VFDFIPTYQSLPPVLAVLHVVVSLAVTVHALLKKQNVRAAIAWIGLAWLSPFAGATLYYVFGINRVTRRAARLGRAAKRAEDLSGAGAPDVPRPSGSIAIVAALGERLSQRSLTHGNAVSILRGGTEAYPAMLSAIQSAKRSVALASYIFRNDSVGLRFVDALADARSRGVEVRVLLDGIGAGYFFCPIARRLANDGVPVARFLHDWVPWRMPFLNMRNHKKLLVVDGTIGFTGGLNIGAENVPALRPANPVSDVHFRVEGPVVSQFMLSFAEDWDFAAGELLDGAVWWPDLAPVGTLSARGIGSGPDQDIEALEGVLAMASAAARRRLRIVTPYFLPDEHLMLTIEAAALAGVEVDVVVPERSDQRLLDWATHAHLAYFEGSGVRLHLEPPPFEHAKLMTVDGCWCLVGSANWDIRSTRLNFEFSLECYGDALATEIERMIDDRIARARTLSPAEIAARPMPLRLRDAAARLFLPYL